MPPRGVDVAQVGDLVMSHRDVYDVRRTGALRPTSSGTRIIYQHGGVYCDIDSLSLRSIDDRLRHAFVGAELRTWNNLENGMFGFPKGNTFLRFVLDSLVHARSYDNVPARTGPTFFTTCFLSAGDGRIRIYDQDSEHGSRRLRTPHSRRKPGRRSQKGPRRRGSVPRQLRTWRVR